MTHPTWSDSWLTAAEAKARRNIARPATPSTTLPTLTSAELYALQRRRQTVRKVRTVAVLKAVGGALAGLALVSWCALWFAFI